MATGAVGINFEDQVVGDDRLYPVADQAARIAAIRAAADGTGVPLFANARTDLFLQQRDRRRHARLLDAATDRFAAYAAAGASGFFAPGPVDEALIAALCEASPLPVKIMMMAGLGVRRISDGPIPYIATVGFVRQQAAAQLVGLRGSGPPAGSCRPDSFAAGRASRRAVKNPLPAACRGLCCRVTLLLQHIRHRTVDGRRPVRS